jgi:hypothetical protein
MPSHQFGCRDYGRHEPLLVAERHARCTGQVLFRGCRLEAGLAAGRERPHIAIKRATGHFHLAGSSRAEPLGDAPRAGILRKK